MAFPVVMYGCESRVIKKDHKELMLSNCGVGKDSWESLGLQGDRTSPFWRRSALGVLWKDWCWSWKSNMLATWCEKLTPLKRPWCWERLKAGREGDDRGWEMAGCHHRLNEHEFEQAPGAGDGEESPACCSPWSCKESDMTEWLNWTEVEIQIFVNSNLISIAWVFPKRF